MSKINDINNITLPVYKRLKKDLDDKAQVVDVNNVNNLSDEVLNTLKAGDIIRKKTGTQYHSYRVSYKEDGQGICLTYCDASLVETVSYDYVNGHWVYNSTDSTDISAELPSTASASAGQILGLDEDKKPEWQNKPSSGTKLYLHKLDLGGDLSVSGSFVSPTETPISKFSFLANGLIVQGNAWINVDINLSSSQAIKYFLKKSQGNYFELSSFYFASGTYTTHSMTSSTTVTDTVTEL